VLSRDERELRSQIGYVIQQIGVPNEDGRG